MSRAAALQAARREGKASLLAAALGIIAGDQFVARYTL